MGKLSNPWSLFNVAKFARLLKYPLNSSVIFLGIVSMICKSILLVTVCQSVQLYTKQKQIRPQFSFCFPSDLTVFVLSYFVYFGVNKKKTPKKKKKKKKKKK